ncbi:MAG: hypothetical protein IIC61_10025 [Proteobacteria bacterium]|nr:hypothetical protein [Pseudomonadota bacterium]
MTDFPWLTFVHKGNVPCTPATLTIREFGASGDASDIVIKCHSCEIERRMADAFNPDDPFNCPGHHPHLRLVEATDCENPAKTILLGASNSWFHISLSALSIPRATDKLGKLVAEHWAELKNTESVSEIDFSSVILATDFDGDTISLGVDDFTVAVADDIPLISDVTSAVTVDESGLALGASDGANEAGDLSDGNPDNAADSAGSEAIISLDFTTQILTPSLRRVYTSRA